MWETASTGTEFHMHAVFIPTAISICTFGMLRCSVNLKFGNFFLNSDHKYSKSGLY